MGYHEERKARDQGEEAQRRGLRSYSNPYDSLGSDNDDRCNREWNDGFRHQERLEEDRREEEEADG